jgi:hypothetical protein
VVGYWTHQYVKSVPVIIIGLNMTINKKTVLLDPVLNDGPV